MIRTAAHRGEVWMAGSQPVEHAMGHEQVGYLPVLVVSSDRFNAMPRALVMVVPLTTVDRRLAHHVRIEPPEGGLVRPSFALCDQLITISTGELQRCRRRVEDKTLATVGRVLRIFLELP